ncbi:MAG: hypothetical protein GX879_07865 [Bacteroidales bacterium]|nr:hypothetical protein [Bacteroidales bacterium]
MGKTVKSGKEILDDFFNSLDTFKEVDDDIISMLIDLYNEGKLTDTNLKNELQNLREKDEQDED